MEVPSYYLMVKKGDILPPEYIKLWANSAWSSVSPVPI